MKKTIFVLTVLISAIVMLAGCGTTSAAGGSGRKGQGGTETTAVKGKNVWMKKDRQNLVYYFLYSDFPVSNVSAGIRNDVIINKGLTVMVTSNSSVPVKGLSAGTFAVKSFGNMTTERAGGVSETFKLNDSAWALFYSKNKPSAAQVLPGLPKQLKAENSSLYTNVTNINSEINWKELLDLYTSGKVF